MGPRWKLEVEGLGKIERAEVDVRPLMLFVGENDSGKSYLASLLWGLLAFQVELDLPEGAALHACAEWLARRVSTQVAAETYTMTRAEQQLFLHLYDEMLAHKGTALAELVFNAPEVRPSRVALQGSANAAPVRLKLHTDPPRPGFIVNDGNDVLAPGPFLIIYLMNLIKFGELAYAPSNPRRPVFLPASRTGFMLFYPSVVRRQIRQLERAKLDKSGLDLTSPAIPLLETLAVGLTSELGPYAAEADFLEGRLHGRVELVSEEIGANRYYYVPEGTSTRLTMSLSSSLVTELAPVILVLRHMPDFPVLILEEPEAHLHPKMQRHLARTIVRLVRKGLYVWITTHSENFCQQINNFLKIGESPKRAELQTHLKYEVNEFLTLDDVSGYQFTIEGDQSKVAELKKTPRGLVMPTFNHELAALTRETLYLQRATTEDGA